jgi:hypothetical protein
MIDSSKGINFVPPMPGMIAVYSPAIAPERDPSKPPAWAYENMPRSMYEYLIGEGRKKEAKKYLPPSMRKKK